MPLVITPWSENIHLANLENSKTGRLIYVRTVTINDLLKMAEGKTIIKMDIEGAEHEIFKSSRWLDNNRIMYLAVEAHGSLGAIVKTLMERGFTVSVKHLRYTSWAAKYWFGVKPQWYAAMQALYRYLVSSLIKTPQIKILYASRIS